MNPWSATDLQRAIEVWELARAHAGVLVHEIVHLGVNIRFQTTTRIAQVRRNDRHLRHGFGQAEIDEDLCIDGTAML